MNATTRGATRSLVERFVDWAKIEERLCRYPAIARTFPIQVLRDASDRGPFFCHPMAWRLGTYVGDTPLQTLDQLISRSEALEGWEEHFRSYRNDRDFEAYWALLWELQCATMFQDVGAAVRWTRSGPDIKVETHGKSFFVECYVWRKSFGLAFFLEELLAHVDERIEVGHNFYMLLSLPTGAAREAFLDELLAQFADDDALARMRAEADSGRSVSIRLPGSARGLTIKMRGGDFDPCLPASDPDRFLEMAWREAMGNKADSNSLAQHRPNVLAVSFLQSTDFQSAVNRSRLLGQGVAPRLPTSIDATFWSACGIDEFLQPAGLEIYAPHDHPMLTLSGLRDRVASSEARL